MTTQAVNLKLVQQIDLKDWQKPWAERAKQILLSHHGFVDTSKPGSGKTILTLWIAKQFGFRILVVCPKSVVGYWKEKADMYGVSFADQRDGVITFESLASTEGHQPKHSLLTRRDITTDGGVKQVVFGTTQYFRDLVSQGILLVVDEIHKIKNLTCSHKAIGCLMECLIGTGGMSRFALLGGTPNDDIKQIVNFLRLIGYIQSPRLFFPDPQTGIYRLEGLQELINVCNTMNLARTTEIHNAHLPINKKKGPDLCYQLYTQIIKGTIAGGMVNPDEDKESFSVKNGFFKISKENLKRYQDAVNEMMTATNYNPETGEINPAVNGINGLALLTKSMVTSEGAKAPDMARIVTKKLQEKPKCKAVIAVNHTNTIMELAKLLLFYSPVILNGDVKEKDRNALITKFNKDAKCRVIIMNTKVGGVGINLHNDSDPDGSRFMLISPSYHMIDIVQATYRIHRTGAMGRRDVRIFYGKELGKIETGILTAMARRSPQLKGMLAEEVANDIKLPGEYEVEEEQ